MTTTFPSRDIPVRIDSSMCLIVQILRNIPFMTDLSERFFNLIVSKGVLMRYEKGDIVWAPPEAQDNEEEGGGGAPCERSGLFIVLAGLIKRTFTDIDGRTEVIFLALSQSFKIIYNRSITICPSCLLSRKLSHASMGCGVPDSAV